MQDGLRETACRIARRLANHALRVGFPLVARYRTLRMKAGGATVKSGEQAYIERVEGLRETWGLPEFPCCAPPNRTRCAIP